MKSSAMKCFALIGVVLFLGVAVAPSINAGSETPLWPPKKPDLITLRTSMYFHQEPNSHYSVFGLFCIVKNIGAPINDWGVSVDVILEVYNSTNNTFEIYDTFFGAIGSSDDLKTGETIPVWFVDEDKYWGSTLPYGIIRLRFNSSIYWPIGQEEEYMNNNERTEIYYHPSYQRWIHLWTSFENNLFSIFRFMFWRFFDILSYILYGNDIVTNNGGGT